MIDGLLSLVAPHLCSGCGSIGGLLCDNCKYDIIDEPYIGCVLCELPSANGVCAHHRTNYQKSWCIGVRKDTLLRLVDGYKFENTKAAYKVLGNLLDEVLPDLPVNTVIVPVPTVAPHIRTRGYDHMALIAHYLANKRRLTFDPLVTRHDKTTQHFMNRTQRIKQASAAFHVTKPISKDATYLILDDIITTGSTINAVAQALKTAGATTIWVATIARQPLD